MRAWRIAQVRARIALVLIAAGVLVLGWVGVDAVLAAAYQRGYHRTLQSVAPPQLTPVRSATAPPAIGQPIGWLEIPRVGLAAAVVHGDTDALLKTAIGHLADTPLPWNGGNSALAGHRDTFFRPLEHVRRDDTVRLKTPHGDFAYRVRETLVVDPEDLWVLDPTPSATLTLITCYPFKYIGNAPRRFIVRAERIATPLRHSSMMTSPAGAANVGRIWTVSHGGSDE
jgi:sortase A